MVLQEYQAVKGTGRRGLWRKVQHHARRRGGGWCRGVPGILKGQGGWGCGGRCSPMLEEEGEDGIEGYQAVRGAGRRGLWREVQRHARRRGGGWCTGSYQASSRGREAVEGGAAPC